MSNSGTAQHPEPRPATPERMRYAAIIDAGTRTALGLLIVTFAIYIFRIIPPLVPRPVVVEHWHESAEQFAAATGSPTGWSWAKWQIISRGDYLCFIGLALLGVLTIVAFFSLILPYIRQRNWVYLGIVLVQITVLALAASNLLGGLAGH